MIQPATGHFGAAAVAVAVSMGASAVYAVGRNTSVLNTLVEKLGKRVKPLVITGAKADKDVYGRLQVDMTLNLYPPGSSVENVTYGFPALKAGGTLVLMGGIQEAVAIPYRELMFKCITVKGNFMFPQSAVPKIIALAEAGLLDLDVFEEKSFKLEDVGEAVELSASQENRGWLFSSVLEPGAA
jgi:alcohol dehydrogenase